MKLYWLPISFIAEQTVGLTQPGYSATNLENTAINLHWQSADRNMCTIKHTLSSATPIHHVFFHDVNVDENAVTLSLGRTELDFDIIPGGLVKGQTDNYDRSWVNFEPFENGYTDNYQYVWIEIAASQTTLDGNNFYRFGASHIMIQGLALGFNPAWGAQLEHRAPIVGDVLPNGAWPQANVGPEYDVLTFPFNARRDVSQYPEFWITRALRVGHIIVDLEYEPYHIWPMRRDEPNTRTRMRSDKWDEVELRLRELVTI